MNFTSLLDVPLSEIVANPASHLHSGEATTTILICRLGNDSQIAASALKTALDNSDDGLRDKAEVMDVIGGLRSWSLDVDPQFPVY